MIVGLCDACAWRRAARSGTRDARPPVPRITKIGYPYYDFITCRLCRTIYQDHVLVAEGREEACITQLYRLKRIPDFPKLKSEHYNDKLMVKI